MAEEGIVLLENEDSILPLAGGAKLNVFGWASTNPCYGGTGSGALNDAYPTVTLLQGLTNAGIQLNTELENFYVNYKADRPVVGMWAQDWTLPEPNVSLYMGIAYQQRQRIFRYCHDCHHPRRRRGCGPA